MAAIPPPPAAAAAVLEQLSSTKMFGGRNLRFRHQSTTLGCLMTFSIYLPRPQRPTFPCCTGSRASPARTRTLSSRPAPSTPPPPTTSPSSPPTPLHVG
uniref:Uncharacterized protein n=1 Tax=Arundo donax TaxID=35708 RepID=A0A0A9G1F4_ARUDO